MLKGAGGLVAPLALGLALLWDGRLSEMRSSEFRNSVLLALGMVVPWHLAMLILHGRAFLDEYIGYHVLARMRGVEGHAGPIYYYFAEYWHELSFVALVAAVGLFLALRQKEKNWSIAIAFVFVITLLYTLSATKLDGYAIPAFPFLCLLAAFAIRELADITKYAVVCAMIVIVVYSSFQWRAYQRIYGHQYGTQPVSVDRIVLAPLTELTIQARDYENGTPITPLILCLDGVTIPKQQPLFYSNRPVIQAFVTVPPANPDIQKRYLDALPLGTVVSSRPAPIIAWKAMYPQLAQSSLYDFVPIADKGPLVLGLISRSSREADPDMAPQP